MGSDQTTLAPRPRMRGPRDDAGVLPAPPELSIIVPTYNEGENINLLCRVLLTPCTTSAGR